MVAVSKLQRKLLRDIRAARSQFIAVALVIILGIATFVVSYAAYRNLDDSYEYTYERLRMADYWISVDFIPERAAREMDEIPGVVAQGRIVGEVVLDLVGEGGERVVGRVISLPSQNHPKVNDVQVESGSYFKSRSGREILLEKHFAEYHKLVPGDWLTIKRGDNKARFRIAGIVTSPEYIWVAKSAQEIFVTARTFGVIYMPQPRAETLFGMKGLFNEINLIVDRSIDRSTILNEVGQILRTHHIKRLSSKDEPVAIQTRKIDIVQGVRTAQVIERKDHLGNRLLKSDLEGFRALAVLFPALFLFAAALAIYVLLNRLVESQRVQIGLMRALGYGKTKVLIHYLGFALIVGTVGSLLGAVLGHVLANALTMEYARQLELPSTIIEPRWGVMAVGILIGIVVPLVAGFRPAWATAGMHPAEAMRPVTPTAGRRTLLETLLPFLSRLPQILKLPLRNVFRNPRRTFFMAIGVSSAIVMVLVSMSFVDATEAALFTQFERIQNFDARINFGGKGIVATTSFIDHLEGIKEADAILEAPYRIRHGERVSDSSIMGLPAKSSLYSLFTPEGDPTDVAREGILLTRSLQKKLAVEVGDQLRLEPIVGTIGETEKQLTGFVDEPFGNRAFLSLREAQKLLRTPGVATGVLVSDAGYGHCPGSRHHFQ
jgi:putative ABC transport system permease protein